MAFTYGFYNSLSGDRKYNAIQFGSIFDGIIEDGVFQSIGEKFKVTPVSDSLAVYVGTGRAWFDHTWNLNDTELIVNLDPSNLVLPRIDAIVLEVDEKNRTNSFKAITGTPGSNPEKPAVENTQDVHQHVIAYVTVPYGAESITQGEIENRVGLEDCPFVIAPLQTVSVDQLVAQWQDEFYKWFDALGDILDENAAGNLQNEIARNTPFVYRAHFTVSGWDGTNPYTQTVSLTPIDGGGNITTSSTFVNQPLVEQGDTESETSNRQDCLAILCSGKVVVSGQNEITATVYDVPEMDFDAYFVMKVR